MENEEEDEENVSESAFNRMFLTKTWRIRGARDPLTLMKEKTFDIKRHLIHLLTESPVKFYIVMTITMVKEDRVTGEKQKMTSHFEGGTKTLLRATKIKEHIDASAEKINQRSDYLLYTQVILFAMVLAQHCSDLIQELTSYRDPKYFLFLRAKLAIKLHLAQESDTLFY